MGCSLGKRVHSDPGEDHFDLSILVLGSMGSGKTTIIRAAEIECGEFERNAKRQSMAPTIRHIVQERIRHVCDIAGELQAMSPGESIFTENQLLSAKEFDSEIALNQTAVNCIIELVENGTLEEFCKKTKEPMTNADIQFYREAASRSLDQSYEPTNDDLLRCQWSTRGIHFRRAKHDGVVLRFIDVGGAKEEQIKWKFAFSESFDFITVVISLDSALRQLDQDDESKQTQLAEDLQLLEQTFTEGSLKTCKKVFAFLTKKDLAQNLLADNPELGHNIGIEGIGKVSTVDELTKAIEAKLTELAKRKQVEIAKVFVTNSPSSKDLEAIVRDFLGNFKIEEEVRTK